MSGVTESENADLLDRLRAGDEQAFAALVARHQSTMLTLASGYVPSRAVAEEVVQDTWLAVLRGLDNFEGRSSIRTWLFRILVNRARTAGARERRSVAVEDMGPVVDQSRFDSAGNWSALPEHWEQVDDRMVAAKMADYLRAAIDALPARQREIVILRDIEGLTSEEVCVVLDISVVNQRVLLHRGRSKLRQALESEFGRP
ncbi:MAG: sigma-70 family RNA polymerase sigma factor [Actinobacteria bacterium]|nr:sigma-70 family RNA polymerase sigma factor [Actinomycetota bacterium]